MTHIIQLIKNYDNSSIKKEDKVEIIYEIDRLISQIENAGNEATCIETGDISDDETMGNLHKIEDDIIHHAEEELEEILKELKYLKSSDFNNIIDDLEKILIYSKI